jgi:hypothetical protein
MNIEKLIKEYPNNYSLGEKVRELYYESRKQVSLLNEKMKDCKIYESPDGGRTIYVRGWGEEISTRKLHTNQLNLFDDLN